MALPLIGGGTCARAGLQERLQEISRPGAGFENDTTSGWIVHFNHRAASRI
jgi:hypothetical protein